MSCVGRCSIYEDRPEACKTYPRPHSFVPESCSFIFNGTDWEGECDPHSCLENICCAIPREDGEPEAKGMDPWVGGEPCKHLIWVEQEEQEKEASVGGAASITDELYEALMPSIREDNVR